MFSSSQAGGGDDGVSSSSTRGGRIRRTVLDTRNVVVNLRALAVTSVGVDACKLALAIVTLVRLQPNRGFVFLASIAVWSLSAKLAVICASLAAYGLVLWAANREARRPMAAAAGVFVVAIVLRFLFMVEGAVVVLQDSVVHANATAVTAAPDDAQHLFIPAAPKGVLAKARDLHEQGRVYLRHEISEPHSSDTVLQTPPTPSLVEVTLKILQVNIIHTCSVAVHVVFLLVIRKFMRCTRMKQNSEDMLAEART